MQMTRSKTIRKLHQFDKKLLSLVGILLCSVVVLKPANAFDFQLIGTSHQSNPGAQAISPDAKYIAGAHYVYRLGVVQRKCFVWNTNTGYQDVDISTTNSTSCKSLAVGNSSQVFSRIFNRDRFITETFLWNENQAANVLWDTEISNSSAIGSTSEATVIVGKHLSGNAFIWEEHIGFSDLKTAITSNGHNINNWTISFANGVSEDGRFIVGIGQRSSIFGPQQGSYIWDRNGTFTQLVNSSITQLLDISDNGNVAIGYDVSNSSTRAIAIKNGTKISIGDFAGGQYESKANAVSGDGRVVVGYGYNSTGKTAFYWTKDLGLRNIGSILNGGGQDLGDWRLIEATAVSRTGSRIVGIAQNSLGLKRAFVASVPSYYSTEPYSTDPKPLPSTFPGLKYKINKEPYRVLDPYR